MKFSTKVRYALRFMLNLGLHYKEGKNIKLSDIAKDEDISIKYLEQIVMSLKASGLLNVARGANGGYALSRAPEAIHLLEIVESINGTIGVIECTTNEDFCVRKSCCTMLAEVWNPLNKIIVDFFSGKTLKELIIAHNRDKKQTMYYI